MSEHDDVPTITSEDLNLDTFLSPGIQMFVLNNTTLLSLVEIPLMDQPDAVMTTAANQVTTRPVFEQPNSSNCA